MYYVFHITLNTRTQTHPYIEGYYYVNSWASGFFFYLDSIISNIMYIVCVARHVPYRISAVLKQ